MKWDHVAKVPGIHFSPQQTVKRLLEVFIIMRQFFWLLVHRYLATSVLKRTPTASRYSWGGSFFVQLRQYWYKQTADTTYKSGISLTSPGFTFSFPSHHLKSQSGRHSSRSHQINNFNIQFCGIYYSLFNPNWSPRQFLSTILRFNFISWFIWQFAGNICITWLCMLE